MPYPVSTSPKKLACVYAYTYAQTHDGGGKSQRKRVYPSPLTDQNLNFYYKLCVFATNFYQFIY